jgi:hypothetical protein
MNIRYVYNFNLKVHPYMLRIVVVFRRLFSFQLLHLFLTLFSPFSYTFCDLKSVIYASFIRGVRGD